MRSICAVPFSLFVTFVAAADESMPRPRPMPLDGLHAYAEKIVTAGESLHVRVSSTAVV